MANMNKDVVNGVSETVEIDGYPFFGENITGNKSYNHRELNIQPLLGGTENITRGKYVAREYRFSTDVYTEGDPRIFDEIFQEMANKECEVISPYMGGKFKAAITIEREDEEASPEHMRLDITVREIPEVQPNIPGESFTVPEDVLETDNKKATETDKESNVTKTSTKNNNSVEALAAQYRSSNLSDSEKAKIANEIKAKLKKRKS